MHRIDSDGATVDNKFTNGVPSVTEATVIDADWLTAVQEEIVYVVEQAGITLVKGTNTQLNTAIRKTPSWAAMTLLTPWIAFSHTPSYRLESNVNRVWLKGTTSALISSGSDWDIWDAPVGYRPPISTRVPCVVGVGSASKNGVLEILASGPLQLIGVDGADPVDGTTYTVYLDGISWAID